MKKILIVLLALIFVLSSCGTLTYTGDFCIDGMKDRDESDIDCGGQYCDGCTEDLNCLSNKDCASGICDSTQHICAVGAVDSDGDGISDENDICPSADDTIDADEDGIADCMDDEIYR